MRLVQFLSSLVVDTDADNENAKFRLYKSVEN